MTSNPTFRETAAKSMPGLTLLLLLIVLVLAFPAGMIKLLKAGETLPGLLCGLGFVASLLGLGGFFVVEPNQAAVLTLLGNYVGSERRPGLWWANPFVVKRKITLRVRNFESNKLKVNDQDGNPIEIASVVVWKVVDSAKALFEVDKYEDYVQIQSESALRNLASRYPYDSHDDQRLSLRGSPEVVGEAVRAVRPDHFVFASTSSVYGANQSMPFAEQDSASHPLSLYAATKQAFVSLLTYWVEAHGMRAVTVEFTDTYGPGDTRRKLIPFMLAAERGGTTMAMVPASVPMDFVHVDDAVSAIRVAAARTQGATSPGHEIFAVRSGATQEVRALFAAWEAARGTAIAADWGARAVRAREMLDPWTQGVVLPGWSPRVSLEEGLRTL